MFRGDSSASLAHAGQACVVFLSAFLNSYPQTFIPNSAFNPHLLADFEDYHLCDFVANCMNHVDNYYLLKVDLMEASFSRSSQSTFMKNQSTNCFEIDTRHDFEFETLTTDSKSNIKLFGLV